MIRKKTKDLVQEFLAANRIVKVEDLKQLGRYSSIKTYIAHLRKSGHKIKYVNGIYYYGGIRVKSYTEELLC